MKVQIACLLRGSFALAALAGMTAGAANAADWNGGAGSIKDMSGSAAIPVPAPVPIPDYKPSWYFRLDAGYGTVSEPSISESGYQYGQILSDGDNGYYGSAAGPDLQSLDPGWFSSDFSRMATFGAGVGYYLGGGFRIDATIEKRSNDQAYINGTNAWDSHSFYDHDADPLTPNVYGTNPNGDMDGDLDGGDLDGDGFLDVPEVDRRTQITVTDKIDIDGTVWMANGYYDFGKSMRGMKPYIGAGLGFIWHQFDRTHSTTVVSCPQEVACGGTVTEYSTTASTSANKVSLAAAVMAGVSYQVSDITSLDVGYRYMFLGGTDFVMSIDGTESRVSIGDQHVHQLRAGLRFDVN